MNGGVRLERVELEGFGLYREATQFAFPEALGVLVAPNESGKSTLLAGLVATIFGLPRSGDRDEFGYARFRNRGGGSPFRGVIDLRVDERQVRIRRDFETNEVRWHEAEAEGWREILVEVHNPLARRAAGTYADRVREMLGISSREIFAETFFVGQPMPSAGAIDARVQELLSGAGGGRYAA
ncbi:MAG: hypothetical protein FJX78_10970, partial [Armatimonadetes bacterium]|nr:hypothetical protein [Armatimonadota bacterium]